MSFVGDPGVRNQAGEDGGSRFRSRAIGLVGLVGEERLFVIDCGRCQASRGSRLRRRPAVAGAAVRCCTAGEVLLNRVVRRATFPDMGFRAMRLQQCFDLVHVHAHPVRLRGRGSVPLVMSEGSSSAVYLREYLGWERGRVASRYRRARRVYRALGVDDRLLAQQHATRVYVFSRWARSVNLEWGADPSKTEVLYPGFPTPPQIERGERDVFRFLFVGTDFERKGGFEVVEAFAQVVTHAPHARLTVVTPDPAVPNPDRRFHGWVDAARRSAVLAKLAELGRADLVDPQPPLEARPIKCGY